MEPASREITTRYVIYTKVSKVASFLPDKRWWVHFEGSWESICLGEEVPDLAKGDEVIITIQRRLPDANTSEAPIK